ncbi:hypothetical protein DRN93_05440 [archaeon]|nr:MAG: hypothetical protein DRN32_07865 [Thermococci archaeon]RLG66928.1 MAG: hypothetical protein DRN93_05440 [archaeon]HDN17862.1 hydrogenase nickel incorporation protein HypA [Candidatus Bathyarchaeota archaeon]
MHEWALAEAVIRAVQEKTEKDVWRRVKSIYVEVGELQQIDLDTFTDALNTIGNSIGDIKFVVRVKRAKFKCRRCGYSWSMKEVDLDEEIQEIVHFVPEALYSFFKCPECGSRDYNLMEGRGVWVKKIVLKK